MWEIVLKFSFFVGSLCGLGISTIVALQNKLDSIPSVSILWNRLKSIDIATSFKVSQNSAVNLSGPGLFFGGSLLMTASLTLGVIGLFRLFI